MSRERLSSLAHSDLAFATPWSEPTAKEIVESLQLSSGARVVDLGCGWAELLTRILERYDAVGEGVERSAYAEERARATTLPRVPGRLTFHRADITEVTLPDSAYDLVVCVGSTHLFGGVRGTLAEAARLLRPGGRLLLGDGVWLTPPPAAALAALDAQPVDIPTFSELRELPRSRGFAAMRHWISTPAEWDHYETSWCDSLEQWPAAHPTDGDAVAARDLAAEHRRGYVDGYRGVLGFVTSLLAAPQLLLVAEDRSDRG